MIKTWYFIAYLSVPNMSYIGPLTLQECYAVEVAIPHHGTCREAKAMQPCPSLQGSTACPWFDPSLPKVTVKPK